MQYLTIGAGVYPFEFGKTYIFQQQWVNNRDSWHWKKVYLKVHIKNHWLKAIIIPDLNIVSGLLVPLKNLLFIPIH